MPSLLRVLLLRAVLLILVGGAGIAHAQDEGGAQGSHTVALRNVPLKDALDLFVRRTQADLAYTTGLVAGRRVFCRIEEARTEALLRCLLGGTGLDYLQTSGGTFLLVESARSTPVTGQLVGRVRDAVTGEPLPHANVLLADAATGTAAGPAGRFQLPGLLPGPHRLVVSYVGYAPHADTVHVRPGRRSNVTVALQPRPYETEPVIVDGLQARAPSSALGQSTTDRNALRRLSDAGTADVARAAARQMGVSNSSIRADLFLQGGGPGEHVMRLDGVPVREPTTLGGLLSAFSPHALGQLVTHKAGFGAAHGSLISGAVDASHDLSRVSSRHAALSVDPTSVSGRAEAAWRGSGAAGGGAMMVAGRTSVWEAYRAPELHHRLSTWTHLDPTLTADWTGLPASAENAALTMQPAPPAHAGFTDLHAAVTQDVSSFQTVSASGYYGTTDLTTVARAQTGGTLPERALESTSASGWTNAMAQLQTTWTRGARWMGQVQAYASRHRSHDVYTLRSQVPPGGAAPLGVAATTAPPRTHDEGNRITEWGARAEADVSLSPRWTLRGGLAPQWITGRIGLANPYLGAVRADVQAGHVGSYAEAEVHLGTGTTLTGGTRLTWMPARRSVYAEPRLTVRQDWALPGGGDAAVRLAGGLYRQFVMESRVTNAAPGAIVPAMQFWMPLDGSMAPARAWHLAADGLWRPSEAWTLRLELYGKHQPRRPEIDYAGLVRPPTGPVDGAAVSVTQSQIMTVGQASALGAGLRVAHDRGRVHVEGTAEAGRARHRTPGRFNGASVPTPWDTPLRVTGDVDVRVAGPVHATAHWESAWGRTWGVRRALYDYTAFAGGSPGAIDLDRPQDQARGAHAELDLGLHATVPVRGTTVRGQIRVANVFDRANPYDRSLRGGVERVLPGRRVGLGVEVAY